MGFTGALPFPLRSLPKKGRFGARIDFCGGLRHKERAFRGEKQFQLQLQGLGSSEEHREDLLSARVERGL